MIEHIVKQGECLSSISYKYGFGWKTIWNLSENSDLRAKRKDPNILYPGDLVKIPARQLKKEPAHTGKCHRFELISDRTSCRIRLLFEGNPRSNVSYVFSIDGKPDKHGNTDDYGYLKLPIPPNAACGTLCVGDPNIGEKYEIIFGALDPIDTIEGIQERLNNLGYKCGPVDGIIGDMTRGAVRSFQMAYDLVVDGDPGPITKGKLAQVHGG
jgi:hypothetical protein